MSQVSADTSGKRPSDYLTEEAVNLNTSADKNAVNVTI